MIPTQTQAATTTATGVLVLLEVKQGVTRDQVMAVMPAEIRATAQLYLDGKIQQWYSRGDGRGVVFLLNTGDVDEARALTETLPLTQEHLVDEQYISVGPLAQLSMLLAGAA
jgi:hypothetical protein